MPFVKKEIRRALDPAIDELVIALASVADAFHPAPSLSYIIWKLLDEVYDLNEINALIEAIGILEETKLNLALFKLQPKEVKSLVSRFDEGE